jgi:hypothetical protein
MYVGVGDEEETSVLARGIAPRHGLAHWKFDLVLFPLR